ncbi:Mitochondrial transcription factor 1 [Arthrobotrys megalospora]
MRAATRLKTIVTDRGLLGRHSFGTVVTPIASCQWRTRNYSTGTPSADEPLQALPKIIDVAEPRRRGRAKRTPEENAIAKLEKEAKKAAKAAAARAAPFQTSDEAFKEEFVRLYGQEAEMILMKPMRRPVGRPKRVLAPGELPRQRAPKKRPVGRPKKRGRRYGSKNKAKEIGPKAPKVPKRVPLADLEFGPPKPEVVEEEVPKVTRRRQKRSTTAERKADESGAVEELPEDAGRPKKYGPELPSRIIIDQGVKKRVYLRPGRAKLFFSEDERKDRELRQAQEEMVQELRSRRRTELAEYGIGEDGTKRRRKTPLDYDLAGKLMKRQLDRPTGPKAYPISTLTRIARDFLSNRKKELEEQGESEYLLDDEGQPVMPAKKKGPGGNTRQKLRDEMRTLRKIKRWDGTTHPSEVVEEKWRLLTPKKALASSPTVASLLESGIPQPRPPTEKSLIMGETKCEEIFKRFDFSEYEGCDIIDFNPGYGLFSRELNKAIKPSKHILLEHEGEFVPFLEHTCTDASFEIVQKDFYDWKTFDDLIKEKKISPKKMTFEEGVNKTLLVTGMLHKEVKGDRFAAQILDAMAQRHWVFRYGRIKFLLWADEEQVARYLPRTFGRRNRAAVMVEAFADLREIATPPPFYTWADHRFFFRIDAWNRPEHVENKQDIATGVKYANQLTYITMPREPPPVIFETEEYWPPLPWAQTSLLDFTPKLPLPYLRGDIPDSEPWKFFNLFLTSSFLSRHTTMRQVLSKVGEGAEQMLETEEVLKQNLELPDKHAVHVSVEELATIAQAYEFWPWRNDDPFLGSDLRLSRSGMLEELEDVPIMT